MVGEIKNPVCSSMVDTSSAVGNESRARWWFLFEIITRSEDRHRKGTVLFQLDM